MSLFTHAPKSICFLRLSAIGDVCHAVAAIQALQKHWPETKVTWIIGKVEAQLLDGLDNVEFIVFDKKAGLKGMKAVWNQLNGRKFDALVHMQLALRASLLTLGIKATHKVGFNFKRAKEGQWLFTNKKISDTQSQHVLDGFFSFIEYLGVERTQPTWRLPIHSKEHDYARNLLSRLNGSNLDEKPTVIISPAASKDERNWLTERYATFADYVIEQGFQVVLCGSPAQREIELADAIQANMKQHAINLVGKTNLKQLTALVNQASAVLAPDSGPAHIATTQGTPVIGLYGHSNPKRTGPYNDLQYVVSVYEKFAEIQHGKPIDELPWSTRVKGSDIMQAISVEAVIERFDALIRNTPSILNGNNGTSHVNNGTSHANNGALNINNSIHDAQSQNK